jgi:hypothetical protein
MGAWKNATISTVTLTRVHDEDGTYVLRID